MRDNSTDKDRVLTLMAKKMGAVASPEELEELAAILFAKAEYSFLAEVLSSLKGNVEHVERGLPEVEVADSGWENLALKMERRTAPVWRIWRWSAAAVVILVVGGVLAFAGYYRFKPGAAKVAKFVSVEYGGKKELVLADGTKVWLNAGSKLIYPSEFAGATREVSLEGEALFDVADRKQQPFFVHTGKITVRVLGTRFEVKAYQEDKQVTATLISGKIQVVLNDDPEKEILLKPHEKLTLVNSDGDELRFQVKKSEAVAETAWVENKLVFNNERMEEVARQLERRYAVRIDFEDDELKGLHVSGVFEKESLTEALEILKMTTRFNYKVDSNRVNLVMDQN